MNRTTKTIQAIAALALAAGMLTGCANSIAPQPTAEPTQVKIATISGSGGVLAEAENRDHSRLTGFGSIKLFTPDGDLQVRIIDGVLTCGSDTIPSFPCGVLDLDVYYEKVKK